MSIGSVVGSLEASGSLAACTIDGQIDCKATSSFPAALAAGAGAKIVSGQSLAGISGSFTVPAPSAVRGSAGSYGAGGTSLTPTLSDCASDGQVGCVAVGPSYAAALTAGAASKILLGQSLAGVAGNVTLPAPGKVLTGSGFGASGNAFTGTLTLPLAQEVRAGSSAYGDPGAQLSPSYSPDFPSVANVRTSDTVEGQTGTLLNCTSDGQVACVADSRGCLKNGISRREGRKKAEFTPVNEYFFRTSNAEIAFLRQPLVLRQLMLISWDDILELWLETSLKCGLKSGVLTQKNRSQKAATCPSFSCGCLFRTAARKLLEAEL